MLVTRPMVRAILEAIKNPRDGAFKLQAGKVYLRDKVHGDFRPVCLKNRVLHTLEES